MGYQFIHINGYGRSAGAGKAGGHSIRSIVAEAGREPGACDHVEAPQPPQLLWGRSLADVEAEAMAWGDQAKDARGHRLRKDGLCLLAGVVSAPDDMSAEGWQAFKADTIEWLAMGGRLVSVVEHGDESHRHIHFYKIAAPGERFDTLHPGRTAAAAVRAEGGPKGEQNKAYREAMRGFQSDFFSAVASKHGLTRIGPAKRRLTRSEWKAEQIAAKAMAEARAQAEAAKIDAAAMIQRAEEAAKIALAEADKLAAETIKAAKARQLAKADADRAEKDRKVVKATAERIAREKVAMARVADQVKADREAIAAARKHGGKLGQMWDGFVDFFTRKEAKAKREREAERQAEAAKLAAAEAKAKQERERADHAEMDAKRARRDLVLVQKEHRETLGKSEAERLRAEMALAKHLGPVQKQPARAHRM